MLFSDRIYAKNLTKAFWDRAHHAHDLLRSCVPAVMTIRRT